MTTRRKFLQNIGLGAAGLFGVGALGSASASVIESANQGWKYKVLPGYINSTTQLLQFRQLGSSLQRLLDQRLRERSIAHGIATSKTVPIESFMGAWVCSPSFSIPANRRSDTRSVYTAMIKQAEGFADLCNRDLKILLQRTVIEQVDKYHIDDLDGRRYGIITDMKIRLSDINGPLNNPWLLVGSNIYRKLYSMLGESIDKTGVVYDCDLSVTLDSNWTNTMLLLERGNDILETLQSPWESTELALNKDIVLRKRIRIDIKDTCPAVLFELKS